MKSKLLLGVLILTTALLAADRPPTPSATTLNSPTSQIAAWYRYAVDLEAKVAALTEQVKAAEAVAGINALRARIAALEAQVVPRGDFDAKAQALAVAQMEIMRLTGELDRAKK